MNKLKRFSKKRITIPVNYSGFFVVIVPFFGKNVKFA